VRAYLTNEVVGLGLKSDEILWMFDSRMSAPAQIDRIGSFLKGRNAQLAAEGGLTDVFVYYVGHGAFPEASNDLFMLVRESEPENWDTSCIVAKSLARRIRGSAAFARQIVVLDCCFSGASLIAWQAEPAAAATMIRSSVEEEAPSTGAVLICSSAADMVSMAPPDAPTTMFTGALMAALRKGSPELGAAFSPRDARDLTWSEMKALWKDAAVRPVVVGVDRGQGDISEYAAFPNPASNKGVNFSQEPRKLDRVSELFLQPRIDIEPPPPPRSPAPPPARSRRSNFALYWAIAAFCIALVAGYLGFGDVASAASGIAQILFFVSFVIFVFNFFRSVLGRLSR
jgi:uncharacterized membrane protein YtjA (UPF0391 family)